MLYHYVLYLQRIRFFLQSCGGVDGKYDVRITKYELRIWEEWRALPAGMSRELRECLGS